MPSTEPAHFIDIKVYLYVYKYDYISVHFNDIMVYVSKAAVQCVDVMKKLNCRLNRLGFRFLLRSAKEVGGADQEVGVAEEKVGWAEKEMIGLDEMARLTDKLKVICVCTCTCTVQIRCKV